jgi:hypothetical protein
LDNFFSNVLGSVADRMLWMPAMGNAEATSPDAYVSNLARFSLPGREPGDFCNPCDDEAIEEMWYSFDWDNVHFVAFNSNLLQEPDRRGIGPGHSLYEWMENDLAAAEADPEIDWLVVFGHFSPYVHGQGDGHASNAGVREVFEDLFVDYGVDLFFAGHQHSYQRTLPVANNGANVDESSCGDPPYAACDSPDYPIYVINGAGGSHLHTDTSVCGTPKPATCNPWRGNVVTGEYGAVRVEVEGRELTLRFVTPEGVTLDQVTIEK